MRALLVIHGYPPRYNAGSENYTQNLAHGLYDSGIDVSVFSRIENPFLPEYQLIHESDEREPNIPVILINHPRSNIRFRNQYIDSAFRSLLDELKPDIVHFGHINHLSTGMVEQAIEFGAKVVFTLHDYWLMCPRGQFLEWKLTPGEPWKLCKVQDDLRCADKCFNRYITGRNSSESRDYWAHWVGERMEESRRIREFVDIFIAPSRHLRRRHVEELGIQRKKIVYLDYGFDLERLNNRKRVFEEKFVFGYIGRHHPSKGIDNLVKAFMNLSGPAELRIWGKQDGYLTDSLMQMANEHPSNGKKIEWLGEYKNQDITRDVFNRCDCIVVPSIWDENSPLVIHEAQQAGVPVITAEHGGMGEYVKNGVNGFTYKQRDVGDLTRIMERTLLRPSDLIELGEKGYLYSDDGNVPSIESHVNKLIQIYQTIIPFDLASGEEVLCK